MLNRREFLTNSLLAGAALTAGGCASLGVAQKGAPMIGFKCKPLSTVRVGVVGLGSRGGGMIGRVGRLPGVRVTAICDIQRAKIDLMQARLQAQGQPRAKVYEGPEAFKALCDSSDVDVIYNTTPWQIHETVCLAALRGGKHVMNEVTSVMGVEKAWEIVEAAEKAQRHCMQLENCIYGEIEMLTFNMVRKGLLGEVMYAEGAYDHDGRHMINDHFPAYQYWRYDWYRDHAGNPYPTHGLVPLCLTMDINRGDRFDYLVSQDSKEVSFTYFKQHAVAKNNPRRNEKVKMGDMNNSLIRTVNGKSILLQHTVSVPRPYSRIQLVQGTCGIVEDYPFRVALEKKCGDNRAHQWMSEEDAAAIRKEYMHPLWKTIGELAKKAGGHGGMDYIQDARWSYCLRMGQPLDTTVYDMATTGCLCELTEYSATHRSKAVDVPDFTRGAWRTAPKMGLIDIDLNHFRV